MSSAILRKLVRNFPENGPKLLCENPANVRDLLKIVGEPAVDLIDFSQMTVERTHFVKPDYAHVATDMLLKAPFDSAKDGQQIFVYVLIEHQSNPQRFFLLRLAEYVLDVYKMQKRAWDEQNASDATLLLNPVLPVVFYSGERSWKKIESMREVIWEGQRFDEMIPRFKPHFLNLRDTPANALAERGGFFGQVLRLIQQRHADAGVFRLLLQEVVTVLEGMSIKERNRWVEFLSYALALVYHSRSEPEHPQLIEVVDESVRIDPHRQEYQKMGRTIAEMFIDQGIEKGIEKGRREGRQEGRQEGEQQGRLKKVREMLLRLLRKRFKRVPRQVEARITATDEMAILDNWLERVLDAATLADVGIQ